MSTALPPPPPRHPPYSSTRPPPPPPPLGTAELGDLGSPVTANPSSGIRTATTVAFAVTTVAMGALAFSTVNRRSAFDDWVDAGTSTSGVDELVDADDLVSTTAGIALLALFASAIVVAIWSHGAVHHGHRVGARNVAPGLAAGGWFIPIGHWFVPFLQFVRVLQRRQCSRVATWTWQGSFVLATVGLGAFRSAADFDLADSADDVSSRLNVQMSAALATTALLAVATIASTKAMRDIDGV